MSKLKSIRTAKLCLLATVLFLGSCNKEELDSQELLVYVSGEYGTLTNSVTIPFVHTPNEVQGNRIMKIAALSTRPVAADVSVSFTADTSLVRQFNLNNKLSRLPLPENTYRLTDAAARKIPAGTTSSDSVQVEITNAAALTNPAGYVLPLKITAVQSADKGVRVSTSRAVVYMEVTYQYNNVQADLSVPTTAMLSRTGWSVTVSNTTTGALGPAMLDNNNTTAWRSSNSTTAAKWVVLDMGASQTVKGLRLTPNYAATTENATGIIVSVSQDNATYITQGTWRGTGPAATSSATAPDYKGINFIAPVQARYYRLDIISQASTSRVGIAELHAY